MDREVLIALLPICLLAESQLTEDRGAPDSDAFVEAPLVKDSPDISRITQYQPPNNIYSNLIRDSLPAALPKHSLVKREILQGNHLREAPSYRNR